MKYWIITDTHFNHTKMIEYCGRPVGFEEKIKRNITKMVKYEDVLIHLGDVCIGEDNKNNNFFDYLGSTNILLRGNHDKKSPSWYMRNGWDVCADRLDLKLFGKRIAFSHIPLKDDGIFDLNIHGHFHNNLHRLQEGRYVVESEKERNEIDLANLTSKHKLLSMEEVNYMPILLETFINKK